MITRRMNPGDRDASHESIYMPEQRNMINDVNTDFKTSHFSTVDQIEEEEEARQNKRS